MDWIEQSQQMFKSFVDTQQKMWESMAPNLKPATQSVWEQSILTWQKSVEKLLESQSGWIKMWTGSILVQGASDESKRLAEAIESTAKTWLDTQKMQWDSWFAMLKQLDPAQISNNSATVIKLLENWQEQAQQMMITQTSWLEKWAETVKSLGNKD